MGEVGRCWPSELAQTAAVDEQRPKRDKAERRQQQHHVEVAQADDAAVHGVCASAWFFRPK
jgi:hypothetical protein